MLAGGGEETITGIPTGTVCTVSEPSTPTPPDGWTFGTPVLSPASGEVTIATKATTYTVEVTNSISRDTGSLKVKKNFDANGSGFAGNFAIDVDCTVDSFDQTLMLAGGGEATITGIPTGTVCTVSEPSSRPRPTGWTFGTPVLSPASGEVTIATKATTYTVEVTNSISRDTGSLKVKKNFDPNGSGFAGNFTINVDCTVNSFDQTLMLAGGGEDDDHRDPDRDRVHRLRALDADPARRVDLRHPGAQPGER